MPIRSILAPAALGAAALLTAALVSAPTAVGGGAIIVATDDNQFSPAHTTMGQGTTAAWWFDNTHSSTSNQRFWNSGPSSAVHREELPSAGRFPYHCTVHSGMNGSITVPLKASGSSDNGWTLRWSASRAGRGRAFDVQYRLDGATTWRSFRTNATAASGLFNPAESGTYQLRARTTNTGASPDKESGWSPVLRRAIS